MTTQMIRPIDQQRAGRLLLAMLRRDGLALRAVLREAGDDPIGTSGLVYAQAALNAELTQLIDPEGCEQQIEEVLLRLARDRHEGDAMG